MASQTRYCSLDVPEIDDEISVQPTDYNNPREDELLQHKIKGAGLLTGGR
jgi:hypothetical protein